MRCRFHLAAVAALLLSVGPALAGASVSFPFTGSNGTTYTGQTQPTDASGNPLPPASLPLPAGAATDASLQALKTALGSPLQAGGTVTTAPAGLGAMQAVPAGSTNGTALGTAPTGAKGARLYLPSGASVTFTVAASAPTAAPGSTFTVSASGTGPNWDEDLAGGQMVYVTAVSGSPLFRWR